ncbi:LacI family DNA-binding transcriptional regulator [Microbacterium dauci]|uniref:LacI family DNA-binding transcriptional regulator n=1 Tax=Microbacterium dauci TaxID=3048008 RepID=A0ABT6ZE96_9MICO|nr:LacI family DNA-binding transcriptional regulator [Microbacterium sp. LX3-4]MDJ1114468.1 LacI family DNA-binding transcriptional regulator [Microbacterium sp. LX3-4]
MTRVYTIYDVAREANVSVATVSNAINRPARVGADTRQRVLDVAGRLGYIPHAAAVYRRSSGRRRIGVIAPFGAYSSYAERLKGVLAALTEDHIEAIVFDHPSASRSPSPRLAALPFSGRLDGLIIMGVPVDSALSASILERDLPTILIDSSHPELSSIVLDDVHGAKLAAEHLVDRGFERFVYVTEGQVSNDYISQGRKRLTGFVHALGAHGIPESDILCITARSGDVAGGRAAADVIAGHARRSRVGVLAGHDLLAAGVLAELRERAVDVPGAVGVVGWDGGELVEALGMTTVHQPLVESGRIGAEQLIARLGAGPASVQRVTLLAELRAGVTT